MWVLQSTVGNTSIMRFWLLISRPSQPTHTKDLKIMPRLCPFTFYKVCHKLNRRNNYHQFLKVDNCLKNIVGKYLLGINVLRLILFCVNYQQLISQCLLCVNTSKGLFRLTHSCDSILKRTSSHPTFPKTKMLKDTSVGTHWCHKVCFH